MNKIGKIFYCFIVLMFCVGTCFAASSTDEDIIQKKFDESKTELLPLTPEQIKAYQKSLRETEKAIRNTPPPKIISRTKRISLTPGSEIPTVKMAPGYVTSLIFYDVTGAPWSVTSQTVGNTDFFQVSRPEVLPGNLLTISPKTNHASTNLVITLADHDLPVSLQLETVSHSDDWETEGLIAFQIDQRGPNASSPQIGETIKSSATEAMMSFVDNIPPAEARILVSSPEYTGLSAWIFDEKIYVRTNHNLLWPAWEQTASGAGGKLKVYSLPLVPSIMISVDGSTQYVSLTEEKE
jgi:intracellular multiplication protein IcmK